MLYFHFSTIPVIYSINHNIDMISVSLVYMVIKRGEYLNLFWIILNTKIDDMLLKRYCIRVFVIEKYCIGLCIK